MGLGIRDRGCGFWELTTSGVTLVYIYTYIHILWSMVWILFLIGVLVRGFSGLDWSELIDRSIDRIGRVSHFCREFCASICGFGKFGLVLCYWQYSIDRCMSLHISLHCVLMSAAMNTRVDVGSLRVYVHIAWDRLRDWAGVGGSRLLCSLLAKESVRSIQWHLLVLLCVVCTYQRLWFLRPWRSAFENVGCLRCSVSIYSVRLCWAGRHTRSY